MRLHELCDAMVSGEMEGELAENWTYYQWLGGDTYEITRGVSRRRLGGHSEQWDADLATWVQSSPEFLDDRIATGAMDLDRITEADANRLASTTPRNPVKHLQ